MYFFPLQPSTIFLEIVVITVATVTKFKSKHNATEDNVLSGQVYVSQLS